MRKLVVLIFLILFSSSFSLIYQNFSSNGTCELHGKYLPINSKYFITNGRTFVKLYGNDTFISYIYGVPNGSTDVFDWYENHTSKILTSGILFVELKDGCNFSIGDHFIYYKNKTLKVDNDTLSNNFNDLLNITFSNGNFTILNKTYIGKLVNIDNLTNFYISNFSTCKNISKQFPFSEPLSYRDLTTDITKFLLTFNMSQNEFLIDNGVVSDFTPNDHLNINGFGYSVGWTYVCGTPFTNISLSTSPESNSSFFLSLQVLNGTTAAFIYNWENCSNLIYQKYFIGQKSVFNLSYENGTIFINTLMNYGNIEKKIFQLMGVNETSRYKLFYPNTTISTCNKTVCIKENGNSDEEIKIKPNKKYVFTNDKIQLNISDVVDFMNKSIEVNPIIYNTSNGCVGDVKLENRSLILSSMKDFQNCSFGFNLSYHIKNKTETYDVPIIVDEPQIKLSCTQTECKYSINSTSNPHIIVKENNVEIYNSDQESGEFSVNPGKVLVIYGNAAGEKEKTIEIQSQNSGGSGSSNSGGSSSGSNGGSGSSYGGSTSGGSNGSWSLTQNKSSTSSNVSYGIKILNNSNNTFNHSIKTIKVSGITGKFIDVNGKVLPWASWVAISLIFVLFIILKFYRKVERRIIE